MNVSSLLSDLWISLRIHVDQISWVDTHFLHPLVANISHLLLVLFNVLLFGLVEEIVFWIHIINPVEIDSKLINSSGSKDFLKLSKHFHEFYKSLLNSSSMNDLNTPLESFLTDSNYKLVEMRNYSLIWIYFRGPNPNILIRKSNNEVKTKRELI